MKGRQLEDEGLQPRQSHSAMSDPFDDINVKHSHKRWFVVDEKLAEADDFGVTAVAAPMKRLTEAFHLPFGVGCLALKEFVHGCNGHHSLELLVDVLGESHGCGCCCHCGCW